MYMHAFSREYAESLDAKDPLKEIQRAFLIPSKVNLKSSKLSTQGTSEQSPDIQLKVLPEETDSCIYLCGNSLGLQPRRTSERINQYLATWATQGVFGHFKLLSDSPLPIWLDVDDEASNRIAPIIGASPSEIAVMQTLTANLHFLMCAFYHPDPNGRHKIILESKAFPSDHYAIESQIKHHGLLPSDSMITIEPPSPEQPTISTAYILSILDKHATTTALLLLPGIQFYTGQFFDIPSITAHARSLGIFVIWDLAHAVGNVPLRLHDWDVDAAAWCTYKYLNSGPGAIGGLFVHERNGRVSGEGKETPGFQNRLSGWWGSDKSARFAMTNSFVPIPGAAGFQLSNPSVLDITSLCASLEVFGMTDMGALRTKSVKITGYLESLLIQLQGDEGPSGAFKIITPSNPEERGAQLSLKLGRGLLEPVMEILEQNSVIVDERRPDVIRVAPAPLYNSYEDCWKFVQVFKMALHDASKKIGATNKTEDILTKEVVERTFK